jgi:hypothetical protein
MVPKGIVKKGPLILIVMLFTFYSVPALAADLVDVDYQALISRSDLVYLRPASRRGHGHAIGNGVMGTQVWTTDNSLEFQINRTDLFAANNEHSGKYGDFKDEIHATLWQDRGGFAGCPDAIAQPQAGRTRNHPDCARLAEGVDRYVPPAGARWIPSDVFNRDRRSEIRRNHIPPRRSVPRS